MSGEVASCKKCGLTKDVSEFASHGRRGRYPWCKDCYRAYQREWFAAHADRRKIYQARYVAKHRAEHNGRSAHWRGMLRQQILDAYGSALCLLWGEPRGIPCPRPCLRRRERRTAHCPDPRVLSSATRCRLSERWLPPSVPQLQCSFRLLWLLPSSGRDDSVDRVRQTASL